MRFSLFQWASTGIVVVLLLLAGCGQESNNLADPQAAATSVCKEAYAEKDCIPGRFIADAVEGLDYQCGKVKARTDVDGSFVCPINTRVTFSLTNPVATADASKNIVFGTYDIRKPALLCVPNPNNDCTNFPAGRLYVTPATLATGSSAQINMVRLLLLLNKDPLLPPTPLDSPSHRIVLSQADKAHLDALAQGITANDFGLPVYDPSGPTPFDDTFDKRVEPFLTALGFTVNATTTDLVPAATAAAELNRAQYATVAGVYSANSLAGFGSVGANTDLGSAGLFGKGTDFSVAADAWIVVDRKGRTLGEGIYAKKPNAQTEPLSYSNYPARPMILRLAAFAQSAVPTVPLWPLDGRLSGLSFTMQDVDGNGDPMPPLSGLRTLTLNRGIVTKGGVAGTRATFTNLFGDNPDAGDELGQWQLEDSSSGGDRVGLICPEGFLPSADGAQTQPCTAAGAGNSSNYTLVRSVPVAPTLDPQLWGNTTNPLFPVIHFPINVKLTFKNSKENTSTTPATPTPVTYGSIYVSILDDGNIVTNLNYDPNAATPDCNQNIDKNSLMDKPGLGGQQEYPVGLVTNISQTSSDDDMPKQVFVTPLLMVPSQYASTHKMLPYIQFASNLNQSFVLRIGANTDAKPKLDAWTVSMEEKNNSTCTNDKGCARFSPNASWIHSWRSWRALATGETKVKIEDASGIVVAEPAAGCYP